MVYKFRHFEETKLVRHGFSTRLGGVSQGEFSSMNLGLKRGDDREKVLKNYDIFCSELGIEKSNIVFSAQTHTTNVLAVGQVHRGNGILRDNQFKDVDGLTTNEKNTALVTFYADCVPLYFLDPVNKAIGLSHGGWRGTLYKIAEKTIDLMKEKYGSRPENILAGIGPSIGVCCFETGYEVYSLFEKEPYSKKYLKKTAPNKKNIDLWGVNKEILIGCGVKPENIEIIGTCTKCNGDVFYSHRNMGDKRGSQIGIMELI